jgi:hypothetical protein
MSYPILLRNLRLVKVPNNEGSNISERRPHATKESADGFDTLLSISALLGATTAIVKGNVIVI